MFISFIMWLLLIQTYFNSVLAKGWDKVPLSKNLSYEIAFNFATSDQGGIRFVYAYIASQSWSEPNLIAVSKSISLKFPSPLNTSVVLSNDRLSLKKMIKDFRYPWRHSASDASVLISPNLSRRNSLKFSKLSGNQAINYAYFDRYANNRQTLNFSVKKGNKLIIVNNGFSDKNVYTKNVDIRNICAEIIEKKRPSHLDVFEWTPLMRACYKCDLSVVEKLVIAGESVNTSSTHGVSPILIAIHKKDLNLVKYLLANGANPNHQVSYRKSYAEDDTASRLVFSGDLPLISVNRGDTPLMLAARQGSYEIANDLILSGSLVDLPNFQGETPLMKASDVDMVKLLLKNGASVNAIDHLGNTALMHSIVANNDIKADILIQSGADLKAKSNNGETATTLAIKYNRKDILRHLLRMLRPEK